MPIEMDRVPAIRHLLLKAFKSSSKDLVKVTKFSCDSAEIDYLTKEDVLTNCLTALGSTLIDQSLDDLHRLEYQDRMSISPFRYIEAVGTCIMHEVDDLQATIDRIFDFGGADDKIKIRDFYTPEERERAVREFSQGGLEYFRALIREGIGIGVREGDEDVIIIYPDEPEEFRESVSVNDLIYFYQARVELRDEGLTGQLPIFTHLIDLSIELGPQVEAEFPIEVAV